MDDIEAWGYTDVVLKSDGELAMLAVQEAIGRARKHSTIPETLSHTRRRRTVWPKEQFKK